MPTKLRPFREVLPPDVRLAQGRNPRDAGEALQESLRDRSDIAMVATPAGLNALRLDIPTSWA